MSELRFTEDHEWVRVDDEGQGIAAVGISDYAQQQLGDLVFVELPEVGTEYGQGDEVAVIESVKAAGDVKTPIGGTVVEVNEALADSPETVNEDPTGAGWFFKVRMADRAQLDGLMNEAAYQAVLKNLE